MSFFVVVAKGNVSLFLWFSFIGCGGDITGDKGVILSPNFPESFPAFSDCVWRIRAPADRYISFRFEEFTGINGTNSECSVDSVEVREGFTREGQLQGNSWEVVNEQTLT